MLFLVFLATPIAEIWVIVQVASSTGVLNSIGLLVLVSLVGAWMVKRQGLGILRRIQDETAAGRIPGKEIVDGLLVLLAGALMLTPGFITDALGLALLFPPTRALVRAMAIRRFARSATSGPSTVWFSWRSNHGHPLGGSSAGNEPLLEAESWEDDPTEPGRSEG